MIQYIDVMESRRDKVKKLHATVVHSLELSSKLYRGFRPGGVEEELSRLKENDQLLDADINDTLSHLMAQMSEIVEACELVDTKQVERVLNRVIRGEIEQREKR